MRIFLLHIFSRFVVITPLKHSSIRTVLFKVKYWFLCARMNKKCVCIHFDIIFFLPFVPEKKWTKRNRKAFNFTFQHQCKYFIGSVVGCRLVGIVSIQPSVLKLQPHAKKGKEKWEAKRPDNFIYLFFHKSDIIIIIIIINGISSREVIYKKQKTWHTQKKIRPALLTYSVYIYSSVSCALCIVYRVPCVVHQAFFFFLDLEPVLTMKC